MEGAFGNLLCTINCYNKPELIPKNPRIEPEAQPYYLNMKIIGLRNLKSSGLLPVKRAFVRFDLDSVARKSDKKQMLNEQKYIKTEPLNPGSNPNILTVVK